MKWIVGYTVGMALLLAPVSLRLMLRSEALRAPLDEAAVREGKMLFTHEWTVNDPLSPTGDGLGPVFNANSCAQCHFQGGLGGSGGLAHNVTTFFVPGNGSRKAKQGVIHAHAISPYYQESLASAHSALPHLVRPTLEQIQQLAVNGNVRGGHPGLPPTVQLSQRNTPALFGARLIDELPDQVILANERAQKLRWRDPEGRGLSAPVGRASILPDGRIGKFGWKAQSADLLSFVQAACANELGLGNPGHEQPAPLARANYQSPGLDLTRAQCEQMAAFIGALPRPLEKLPADIQGHRSVTRGREFFQSVGCAECHVPNLGSVNGVYSDFLLHRMGGELQGGGSYNSPEPSSSSGDDPLPDEWRTPPLWGVADSAPYLHDGQAPTLLDAILKHGGQAAEAAMRFQDLGPRQQEDLIQFLTSLRAPG